MPLAEHTIKFSKIEKYFDVVVSTNSKKVLSIAKISINGIRIRPENFCNNSLTIDVVKYELKRFEKKIKI